jgi:hypothetical protein
MCHAAAAPAKQTDASVTATQLACWSLQLSGGAGGGGTTALACGAWIGSGSGSGAGGGSGEEIVGRGARAALPPPLATVLVEQVAPDQPAVHAQRKNAPPPAACCMVHCPLFWQGAEAHRSSSHS